MNCPYTVQNPVSCGSCFGLTASRVERDQFLRQTLEGVSLYLAPSCFQAELYIKNGFAVDRVKVNENGVKLPLRTRRRNNSDQPDRIVFAHLGGPSEQKGYPMIKAAFEAIGSSNYALRFTDSDTRLGIKTKLGRDLNIKGQVEVVPPFSQTEIDDFFDGIDVLIAYSQWDECFGLVVREALARDVWVITSDAGGLPEAIVNGVNGVIVPRNDQSQLIAAIEACLGNAKKITDHFNPHKSQIRSFEQQALELGSWLGELISSRNIEV
jgi:glycosyltransferase involved in cell wall biosynthesis